MTSKELKELIHKNGYFYWQIAEKIGVSEITLIRWMRGTPSPEHSQRIQNAVIELNGGAVHV